MAIYFGNLDRELADRQNVLKEDAARQYRGSRDMMESFSDLGKTVERGMKDYSTAKLEAAKLNYNIERNKESDQIRKLSFQQSTKRNKELTLDSQLRNVEKFRATSVANHIGKQWYWRDPKTVRAAYDDRMKIFTADHENVDPEQRIKAYPHLFGKKGLASLTYYEDLLKLKEKDGNSAQITDEDLKNARNNLPVAPMGFKDWAINAELFNEKITGNPGRAAGAMQTTILRNAGYDIPNATELNERTQRENGVLQAGVTEEKIQSKKSLAEKELEVMGRNIIYKKKGAKVETSKTNELKKKAIEGRDYEILPDGTIWDLLHGMKRDSIEDVSKFMPVTSKTSNISSDVEVFGDGRRDHHPGTYQSGLADNNEKEIILNQEKAEAAAIANELKDSFNKMNETDALIQYEGRQRYNQPDEVQVAVADGNSFKATNEVAKQFNKENTPVRSPDDPAYNLEGPEVGRDPAFFPFMEGYRGKALGSDYSRLPNYSTWENVSPEEKTAILEHPATVEFGANPKSVAGLIKAEDELKQIDDQILFINGQVSKGSKPDVYDPQMRWQEGEEKTDHWKAGSGWNFPMTTLSSEITPGGGALSPAAQGAISNVKTQQAKDIAKQLPRLENKRKQLAERVKFAEANVQANQSLDMIGKSKYKGRDWGPPSVLPSGGLPIIRPEPTVDTTSGMALAPGSTATEPLYVAPDSQVIPEQSGNFHDEMVQRTMEIEGRGVRGYGDAYFDGKDPITTGNFAEGRGETLTLSGGLNIYGTINSMPIATRKKELEEVATNLFGKGGTDKKEFLRFMNMKEKDHKKNYETRDQRKKLRLSVPQQSYLTGYMMRNHLDRLVKNNPYLSDIAQYPKEMQVFLMDNTFNMGPKWLSKFKKTEVHLKNWVTKGRKPSDLEKMKAEYKKSDHYRKTTRAQDLVAMLTID